MHGLQVALKGDHAHTDLNEGWRLKRNRLLQTNFLGTIFFEMVERFFVLEMEEVFIYLYIDHRITALHFGSLVVYAALLNHYCFHALLRVVGSFFINC